MGRFKYVVAGLVMVIAITGLWPKSKSELPPITNVEPEYTSTAQSPGESKPEPKTRTKPKFLCKTQGTKWVCKLTDQYENDSVDVENK